MKKEIIKFMQEEYPRFTVTTENIDEFATALASRLENRVVPKIAEVIDEEIENTINEKQKHIKKFDGKNAWNYEIALNILRRIRNKL